MCTRRRVLTANDLSETHWRKDVAASILIWSKIRRRSVFIQLQDNVLLSPVTLMLVKTSSGLRPFFSPTWRRQTGQNNSHTHCCRFTWRDQHMSWRWLALMSWINFSPSSFISLCLWESRFLGASSLGLTGRAGTRLTGEGGWSLIGRGAGSGRARSHISHIVAGE